MMIKLGRVALIGAAGGMIVLLSRILVQLAIASQQAPHPEAILVLGGGTGREEAAAQLARYHPELEIWVSSGDAAPHAAYAIFQSAGISSDRLHLDYRASDTVTNFTSLVADFKRQNIQHLYVVTSDFHMPRAKVIATIVLGYNGIVFTPVTVPTDVSRESWLRIVRDSGRSVLWIVTGRTGAGVGQVLKNRFPQLSDQISSSVR